MLTKIQLEGALGRKFGRDWELDVAGPAEAVRMLNANCPGFLAWIRGNLNRFSTYRVVCTYPDGREEEMDDVTIRMKGNPVAIRFIPLIEGSGSFGQIVLGATLVVIGIATNNYYLAAIGASFALGGVVQLLAPQPKQPSAAESKESYYFDGPVNTDGQGVVPLVYGRKVLVGSSPISLVLSVDQLI